MSRETPRFALEYLVVAFGGTFGAEGEGVLYGEDDKRITHHVVDRPAVAQTEAAKKRREFVQPQWVFDCINHAVLLPCAQYAPGKALPPHLSPFVDNVQAGYLPARQTEINALKGV